MKKAKVNTELRQWARGISFTIAMGRRQVFTLISLHLSAERPRSLATPMLVGDRHRVMRHFIQSTHCLVDRGLVVAHIWKNDKIRKQSNQLKIGNLWQLSPAGELVIGLLKEAGIYEEVRVELEAADKPNLRIA